MKKTNKKEGLSDSDDEKKVTDVDIEEKPKYDFWKRDDINETRSTMPVKIVEENKSALIKTKSQGSHWNNAKTW